MPVPIAGRIAQAIGAGALYRLARLIRGGYRPAAIWRALSGDYPELRRSDVVTLREEHDRIRRGIEQALQRAMSSRIRVDMHMPAPRHLFEQGVRYRYTATFHIVDRATGEIIDTRSAVVESGRTLSPDQIRAQSATTIGTNEQTVPGGLGADIIRYDLVLADIRALSRGTR